MNLIMKSIFTLIIITISFFLSPSEEINLDDTTDLQTLLMSKDWIIPDEEGDYVFKYTDTEELYYIDGKLADRTKYYISQTSCSGVSFNQSLVGVRNNGNYLTTEDGNCESVVIENENKIVFYHLHESAALTFTLIAK